jgi:DNA-binding transcriptional LysR family regulator
MHRVYRLTCNVQHLSPSTTIRALDKDDIDFAISVRLSHPKSIRYIDLLPDKMVCILRKHHPLAQCPWTPDVFLKLRHIKIVQDAADTRFVDDDLTRQQAGRNIVLNIPHWLAAPALVEHTDLVTAISERMARRINDHGQFILRPLPLGSSDLVWRLYWHRRYDTHPAHVWMRELIRRSCKSIRA